ncbi:MAG: sensor histidine kinase, partial [Nitrospirota bacterium]
VAVRDTGPGIRPEERENIFQKHYRSRMTAGAKGAGLGLAIVKAVAEAHEGEIVLESEPSVGSTFKLIIPLRQKRKAA